MTKARGRICVPIHIHLVDDDGGDTVGEGWMPEGDVLHSDGRFETDGDVTRLSGERETHSITDCLMQQHLPETVGPRRSETGDLICRGMDGVKPKEGEEWMEEAIDQTVHQQLRMCGARNSVRQDSGVGQHMSCANRTRLARMLNRAQKKEICASKRSHLVAYRGLRRGPFLQFLLNRVEDVGSELFSQSLPRLHRRQLLDASFPAQQRGSEEAECQTARIVLPWGCISAAGDEEEPNSNAEHKGRGKDDGIYRADVVERDAVVSETDAIRIVCGPRRRRAESSRRHVSRGLDSRRALSRPTETRSGKPPSCTDSLRPTAETEINEALEERRSIDASFGERPDAV